MDLDDCIATLKACDASIPETITSRLEDKLAVHWSDAQFGETVAKMQKSLRSSIEESNTQEMSPFFRASWEIRKLIYEQVFPPEASYLQWAIHPQHIPNLQGFAKAMNPTWCWEVNKDLLPFGMLTACKKAYYELMEHFIPNVRFRGLMWAPVSGKNYGHAIDFWSLRQIDRPLCFVIKPRLLHVDIFEESLSIGGIREQAGVTSRIASSRAGQLAAYLGQNQLLQDLVVNLCSGWEDFQQQDFFNVLKSHGEWSKLPTSAEGPALKKEIPLWRGIFYYGDMKIIHNYTIVSYHLTWNRS